MEAVIGDDIPRRARDLFARANEAHDRRNYDYAIALYLEALWLHPGYVEARKLLREAEVARFNAKRGPKLLRKLLHAILHIPHYVVAFFRASFGHWEAVVNMYESILKKNPLNSVALVQLADALDILGYTESAVHSMEYAYKLKPTRLAITRKMGELYKKNGNIGQARSCFETILAKNKDDKDANKAIHDLAAMATITRGQWEDTTTYRKHIKDVEFAEKAEKEVRLEKSTEDRADLIADYEKRVAQSPDNINLLKSLANFYMEDGDYDKAAELFQRAIELNPADPDLPELQFRVRLRKHEHAIHELDEELKAHPDNQQLRARLDEALRNKNTFVLDDLRERVKKYPSNLPLRFDYGVALMTEGKLDEAIREFQQSKNNPQRRATSLNNLGECFRRKGYFDLAVDQFKTALAELHIMDSFKKEVMYNLGRTHEDMGHTDEALAQYKVIYADDIGFRDVSVRLDNLYKKQAQT